MTLDPRTPVLVGAGVATQRNDDAGAALEPIELMAIALERAADDAGAAGLLARADCIRVPKGFPPYADPGRLLARRFGADARTELAEIGILQTTPFGRSVRAIAAGEEDVVLVVGGEAKYRSLRAQIAGEEETYTTQDGVEPDELLLPHAEIMSESELIHGLAMPVGQYALIDNALRYAEGKSIQEHVEEISSMWSAMSRVAADNPDAWLREVFSADDLATASEKNRMLAFPYNRRHNSQWNVDQAAGLILCSVETARSMEIPERLWVFPRAIAESNHMVPLCERAELHRSHGFQLAGARAFEAAGVSAAETSIRELYSCFPAAVRTQIREFGLDPGDATTVTGGMAFAGGPLNNFVLQALARMVGLLRAAPGEVGLLTAVSGLLTKQGVSLWSTEPGPGPCRFEDVSEEVARSLERRPIVADYAGPVRIASATVLANLGEPRAVFVCDTPDRRRTIASSTSPDLVERVQTQELCGESLEVSAGGIVSV